MRATHLLTNQLRNTAFEDAARDTSALIARGELLQRMRQTFFPGIYGKLFSSDNPPVLIMVATLGCMCTPEFTQTRTV